MSDVRGTTTMARRRHELLLDVEQTAAAAAGDLGVPPEVAQHVGAAVADMLTERWAGQQITYPINGYYALAAREQAIVARHSEGARVYELAREFGMTERGIRKLLSRVAAGRGTIDAQADLFPGGSTASDPLRQR